MTSEEEYEAEYYEFEIKTSVGSFLPWVGKLEENLRHHPDGFAKISFEYDGIRLECSDEHGHPISEEFIPRNEIGAFAALYEDGQYVECDARILYYEDLEELDIWLSGFSMNQGITVCLCPDEGDVGILIGCSLRGGIKNYYGYSECHRPKNTKTIFTSEISRYPSSSGGVHIPLPRLPASDCNRGYDLFQRPAGSLVLYPRVDRPRRLKFGDQVLGYTYIGTYYPDVFRRVDDDAHCSIVIEGFPDGLDHYGVYTGRIDFDDCITLEKPEA